MKAIATGTRSSSSSSSSTTETTTSSRDFGSNADRSASLSTTSFPANTSLSYGSKGSLVELLQKLLNEKGFTVPVTGNYYSLTTSAVKSFQAANKLKEDGIAGPVTLSKLTGSSLSSSTGSTTSTGNTTSTGSSASLTGVPVLEMGSKGSQVKLLQERLNIYGASLKVDGDFGSATERALKLFQAANSLTIDGELGPTTASRLNGSTAKSVKTTNVDDAYAIKAKVAIAAAREQLGVPYKFNTATPGKNFDCSGLTMYAWAAAGIGLTHQSQSQADQTTKVDFDQKQPGDLLFFHSPISHVSIYLGNGQHIHAPQEGDVVKIGTFTSGNVVRVGRPKI